MSAIVTFLLFVFGNRKRPFLLPFLFVGWLVVCFGSPLPRPLSLALSLCLFLDLSLSRSLSLCFSLSGVRPSHRALLQPSPHLFSSFVSVCLSVKPRLAAMFIYLSKKIKVALPNPIPLDAIAWNREYGWIACGGDEGLYLCTCVYV